MSFLGDLVNSIGTNNSPSLPKPPSRPPITSSAAHSNPAPRPKPVPNITTPPIAGLKRKLDERDAKISKPPERTIKPNSALGLSNRLNEKPLSQTPNGSRPSTLKPPSSTASASHSVPTKPPSKGSYAEMIARAKEAQQSRTQNPLGTIKHQATSKEKVSKLAERRRQEQDKLKAEKDKKSGKSTSGKTTSANKIDRKRGVSPIKKNDQPKVPRAPRPPLHAPPSSYKGTMGKSSQRPRDVKGSKKSRYDEYMDTDEDDVSEADGYGDGDGYGSDASSDMEAGIDDIDDEEQAALRAAREDDAKEMALENELKREKEERKRRLQAMAAKRGR